MTQEQILQDVGRFVKKNFLFDENASVGEKESLIGTGVIDSTGALELISFLEKRFELQFDDDELVVENFDSLERIASFTAQKIGAKQRVTP